MSDSKTLQQLAAIPRGRDGKEELRVSLDEFTPPDGPASQYLSARVWFKKDDGSWCPTKKGVTIRRHEIAAFGLALKEGLVRLNGEQPTPRHPPVAPTPPPKPLPEPLGEGFAIPLPPRQQEAFGVPDDEEKWPF